MSTESNSNNNNSPVKPVRPVRPLPISEGCAQKIWDEFLGPLSKYKHAEVSVHEYLDWLFDVPNRKIYHMQAAKPFEMQGILLVDDIFPIQGLGYRQVKTGTIMLIRENFLAPEHSRVDIEINMGQGGATHVYRLSQSEWDRIKPLLSHLDNLSKHARKHKFKASPYHKDKPTDKDNTGGQAAS